MLDREPCKNGEWLSDMGNVDVSAVLLGTECWIL
jgi:hypothetical protein